MAGAWNQESFQKLVVTILAVLVIIIFFGCIYAFFRAIFLFIFSQGKDDKIKSAWTTIRYMIWGIILTIALLFVFPLIFGWIGVTHPEKYKASAIFSRSAELIGKVSKIKSIIEKSQKENEYNGDLYYTQDKIDSIEGEEYEL